MSEHCPGCNGDHLPNDGEEIARLTALLKKEREDVGGLKSLLNDALRRNEEYVAEHQEELAAAKKRIAELMEEIKVLRERVRELEVRVKKILAKWSSDVDRWQTVARPQGE